LLTAPVSGLLVAALSLRYIGGGISGSTSDEYLQSFHDSQYRLGLRALVARSIAAIASLGTGGSLGLEGPSLYGGSTLGEQIQR
ncbi:MAG: chloride channel protein, partial [Ilumatobacteraceae bacterium]